MFDMLAGVCIGGVILSALVICFDMAKRSTRAGAESALESNTTKSVTKQSPTTAAFTSSAEEGATAHRDNQTGVQFHVLHGPH